MKTLIAGFGSIGRRHLNNLRALGEQDFVLLRSHHSTLPDDDIKGIPFETDIEKALAHKPDAVVISNPTALHLAVALPAAKAGCSILMEKPVSHSLEGIDELGKALAQTGAPFLTAFQYRYHPLLRQVKQILDSGEIGIPVSCRVHWGEYLPGWHPWEDYRKGYAARADLGGGVVNSLCHPFDYLRWFFGDVQSLWAYTSSRSGLGLEVEDNAEVAMKFRSGVISSVHLDYVQRPGEHSMKIIGSQGTLKWSNTKGSLKVFDVEGSQWKEYSVPAGFERNSMFIDEMKHFIALTQRSEPSSCTFEDGVAVLQLTEAVHRSAHEGVQVEFGAQS